VTRHDPLAIPDRIAAPRAPGISASLSLALLLVCAVAVVLINPVGFRGGGGDDFQYLDFARCWVKHGPCLPVDHWDTRLPLIMPMAATLALFGEGRWTLSITPLVYALAALVLFHAIVRRLFGATVALVAGVLLVTAPVFAGAILQPNGDIPELAFQLAAVLLALRAREDGEYASFFATGIAAALTVAMRETSLAFVGPLAVAMAYHCRDRGPALRWFASGVAVPIAAECVGYALVTGDPFYRFRLALDHNLIRSSELKHSVDIHAEPLFNPMFIAGWKPAVGIDLHWTINPIVNLLCGLQSGPVYLAAIVLAIFAGRRLRHRLAPWVAGAAVVFLALTYGLAVDPKARMFLLPLAVAAMSAAACACAAPGRWRWLATLPIAAAVAVGLWVTAGIPNLLGAEEAAPGLLARAPGPVAIDSWTRAVLTLVPAVATAPLVPHDAPYRFAMTMGDCHRGRIKANDLSSPRTVIAEWRSDPKARILPYPWLRHDRVLADTDVSIALCLLERRR
jgi:4-amino-4-deoxy-L-arabinose transferase-like glycosyltransferase